jgi:hypothetical protein
MKASLQGKVRRRKAWCKSGCEELGDTKRRVSLVLVSLMMLMMLMASIW